MKRAGCFNVTKTSYRPKDQVKFGFSCHDPFNHIYAKRNKSCWIVVFLL